VRYALTGATGFVGGALVDLLLEEGHEVVAIVRTPGKARDLESRGVELVVGDVTDTESMRPTFEGVDGVFHLAAWYEVAPADPRGMERINVDGTRNVLELVDELAVPKVVYTSTLAVFSDTDGVLVDEKYRYYGPHLTEYDRTKWVAHYEVAEPMAEAGLPVVTVMPGTVYGPGDTSSIREAFVDYLTGQLPTTEAVGLSVDSPSAVALTEAV
jgi:nucleoside-diphosphate-sugar epimerase